MNSQEDTILINILLDLRRKLQYIFGYSKAPRSSDSNESRMKSIEVSHKKLWPKHRRSCTLKFSGQHIELYFGIYSILDAGENQRRRGEEQRDENMVKEIRMPTMKRSLGCGFIKHT